MAIGEKHAQLADFSGHLTLSSLVHGPQAALARQCLEARGKLQQRASPLRPQFMFWLVLALVLMRTRSVPNVFAALVDASRKLFPLLSRKAVSDGALAHARLRLGPEVFCDFFQGLARQVPATPWFHGLRPLGVDGVRATMSDSPANLKRFPRQKTGRGRSAWPQLCAVCLVDLASHSVLGADLGSIHKGERTLVQGLWPLLMHSDVVVEDRGFFSAEDLWGLNRRGLKFVCRMPESVKPRLLRQLGSGDSLVELQFRRPLEPGEKPQTQRGRPSATKKVKLVVRMLEYRLRGAQGRYRLATNVFDPAIAVKEFAGLYHWRWDTELTFDELKTHLQAVCHGKQHTTFRGKNPALVEQEFWAMLSVYNMVRQLMSRAAKLANCSPLALSFTESVQVIEGVLHEAQTAPAAELSGLYLRLLRDLAECRMKRWRRSRAVPRVVKVKMSNFPVKRRCHKETALSVQLLLPKSSQALA